MRVAAPKQQRIDPAKVTGGTAGGDRSRGSGGPAKGPAAKKSAGGSRKPGGRPPGVAAPKPATARDWVRAARPLTLPLAVTPVALGTATASALLASPLEEWLLALLCLVIALALQIGVNFANDYSDGVRGTDAHRVGPARLVGSGAASPKAVLRVAIVFFAIAGAAGVALVVLSQLWWLLAVGAVAIAAAWFYTGGRRPYGYAGLGELAVFVFFGLVATAGTMYVQVRTVTLEGWLVAVAAGLLACAVLMSNNVRDRDQDAVAGKRTLAVRIGELPSRILTALLLLAPFGILVYFALLFFNAYYVYFALLAALPAVLIVLTARTPPEHLIVLRLTLLTSTLYGLGLAAAIAL